VVEQTARPHDPFVLIGTVTRPHGLKGEVKVHAFSDAPGNFHRYRRLFLSADGGQTRVAWVNTQARVNGSTVILRLEGCTTREQAEELAGLQIWLAVADLPALDQGEFYLYSLEGKEAQTPTGSRLGTVTAIVANSGQDLLVLKDGQREYLVPVVRAFVVAIDDHRVVLDLPPGLLEINA